MQWSNLGLQSWVSYRMLSSAHLMLKKAEQRTLLILVTYATTAKRETWAQFGYFLANLRTFWYTFAGLNNAMVYQNWHRTHRHIKKAHQEHDEEKGECWKTLSVPNFKLFCCEDRKYTLSGFDGKYSLSGSGLAVSLFRPKLPKLTQDHVMAQLMIYQDWTSKGEQKMQILMSMLDPKRNN